MNKTVGIKRDGIKSAVKALAKLSLNRDEHFDTAEMKKNMKIMLALGGSMYLMAIHYFVYIYVFNNMKDVRQEAAKGTYVSPMSKWCKKKVNRGQELNAYMKLMVDGFKDSIFRDKTVDSIFESSSENGKESSSSSESDEVEVKRRKKKCRESPVLSSTDVSSPEKVKARRTKTKKDKLKEKKEKERNLNDSWLDEKDVGEEEEIAGPSRIEVDDVKGKDKKKKNRKMTLLED